MWCWRVPAVGCSVSMLLLLLMACSGAAVLAAALLVALKASEGCFFAESHLEDLELLRIYAHLKGKADSKGRFPPPPPSLTVFYLMQSVDFVVTIVMCAELLSSKGTLNKLQFKFQLLHLGKFLVKLHNLANLASWQNVNLQFGLFWPCCALDMALLPKGQLPSSKKSMFWKADRCSTSGNNCSMFTYVIGLNFLMFIWARITHIQNRFWPLSSFGAEREASLSNILGSHSRSGIFSSRKSSKTEHRKAHSNYVREHRRIVSRCGTSICFSEHRVFFNLSAAKRLTVCCSFERTKCVRKGVRLGIRRSWVGKLRYKNSIFVQFSQFIELISGPF